MTDLILQDLNYLTSEGLAQILSKEKREILGEQRVPAKTGLLIVQGLIHSRVIYLAQKGRG
jgi:hypothetical protein